MDAQKHHGQFDKDGTYTMNVKKATTSPCDALKCTPAAFLALSWSPAFFFGAGALFTSFLVAAALISEIGVNTSPFSMLEGQCVAQR